MNADPTTLPVRHALVGLYGAVAGAVRGDRAAIELMLSDVSEHLSETKDVLVTIALATLERLAVATFGLDTTDPVEELMAWDAFAAANSFRLAPAHAVNAAADRLVPVRNGDVSRVAISEPDLSDAELIRGATALLAAVVEIVAECTGRPTSEAAADLCLAASMAALG